MTAEDSNSKQNSVLNVVYRFFGGAALGVFMVIVPYLLSPIELNWLNAGIALLLVISCGLLSSAFGEKFIESLTKLLDSSGLY